jgi:hypothetical protein
LDAEAMTADEWRAWMRELHDIASGLPPDPVRDRALAEFAVHVQAERYDRALDVGERLLEIMPPAPRLAKAPWLALLAWLALTAALLAGLALAMR